MKRKRPIVKDTSDNETESVKPPVKKPRIQQDSHTDKEKESLNQHQVPIYGNYKSYYEKRREKNKIDSRLTCLKSSWFKNAKCLDIGCNSGKMPIEIAENFECKSVMGVDIDNELIDQARKHVRNLVEEMAAEDEILNESDLAFIPKGYFPISCEISHGKLPLMNNILTSTNNKSNQDSDKDKFEVNKNPSKNDSTEKSSKTRPQFPYNISFVCANFIGDRVQIDSESNETITRDETKQRKCSVRDKNANLFESNQFNVITCFSVTKWIHLNWGDKGLKMLFHKVYECLKPEGWFILEPQPWKSYKKKHNFSERHRIHYKNAEFKPEDFIPFLIEEVGFLPTYHRATPHQVESKGFEREILAFQKPTKLEH
eukprot:gb/GECH01013442.1/.p1 GENE.gb/GECH01013442.1/~~gb/GECH01013442.1/.p1  ORF type:complete len:371 (+),score=78.27 gb/GECH01013442.1/:1-1113(+)